MGLDTTHDCWHGAYSAFGRWREGLAKAAGIPLQLMERYYVLDDWMHGPPDQAAIDWIERITPWLPIKWEALKPDVLHILLDHSDCDGWISTEHCAALADRLEELLPLLPVEHDTGHIGSWQQKTQLFITGLRLAAARGENVEFQ